MSMPQIKLAHETDAVWIIVLWLAIHGGDPRPDRLTVTDEEAVRRQVPTAGGEAPPRRIAVPPPHDSNDAVSSKDDTSHGTSTA